MSAPAKAYLLSFDNRQQYEDHHVTPLFLVKTKARAEAIVIEASEWIEAERAKLPENASSAFRDRPGITDQEYIDILARMNAHLKALVPPYGIEYLRDVVEPDGVGSDGVLVIQELSYLT